MNKGKGERMGTVAIFVHDPKEDGGNIRSLLLKKGFTVREFHLYKGERPQEAYRCDALVLMGGPMSVKEEGRYPFLKTEKLFLEKWLKSGRPLLGICLGAQLIADVLGGRVYKGPVPEIGWSEVRLTLQGIQDPVFSKFPSAMLVFQWHEETFDLPAGAVLLASSPLYPNQAYRIGKTVYGVQFHLEVTFEMVKDWLKEEDFPTNIKQEILKQSLSNLRTLKSYCETLVDLFNDGFKLQHTKSPSR